MKYQSMPEGWSNERVKELAAIRTRITTEASVPELEDENLKEVLQGVIKSIDEAIRGLLIASL